MTPAERLRALAGISGTPATLLLLIGMGSTPAQALVDYSGLSSGTAAQHLLVDHDVAHEPITPNIGGGFMSVPHIHKQPIDHAKMAMIAQQHEEDEIMLQIIINAVTQELIK